MFSTNLIQSNYGDLNIKSLAFDSFKERLQSTMTALTFFISTGQCDCDEIAESNLRSYYFNDFFFREYGQLFE